MIQLRMFGRGLVKNAHLIAVDSPRRAFYNIWIEEHRGGGFRVCKESGGGTKVSDRRVWEFATLEEAEKVFQRRIRQKTNQHRKSARKYRFVHLIGYEGRMRGKEV
jgi:hypothetical protein